MLNNLIVTRKCLSRLLIKNYTKIWGKSSNLMDITFASEPVYGDNDKYIRQK